MSAKRRGVFCSLLAVAGLSMSPAAATPIELAFEGHGLGQNLTVHHAALITPANPDGSIRVSAGENIWTIGASANGQLQTGAVVRLFSTSIGDQPLSGNRVLKPLSDSAHLGHYEASVGRATLLRNLYSTAYAHAAQSNIHAAAFQAAIWEIVHEGDFDTTADSFQQSQLNVLHSEGPGGFHIGAGREGPRDPVAQLANQWLETAWLSWRSGAQGAELAVATGDGFNEQVMFFAVPLPSAGGLALVGIGALGLYRRRRS